MDSNHDDTGICVESVKKITEIFGGKWSFVIVGELHTGTKRFNELSKNLNISAKSLSDALKSLESNGIITRTVYSTVPVTVEYSLTAMGSGFDHVLVAMKEWGIKWLKEEV